MSDSVWIAIIAAVPATVAAIVGVWNHLKIQRLDIRVDGRLTQLLDVTGKKERAEGHEAGRLTEVSEQIQRDEKKDK